MANQTRSKYSLGLNPIMKNKHVRTYSHIAFSMLAILIFSLFAIRPTVNDILARQKTINEQQNLLDQLRAKANSIAKGIDNYKKIDDTVKMNMISLVPSTTSLPCLVNNLNSFATYNQINISGIQIQPVELKGVTKCLITADDLNNYNKNANPNTVAKEIKFTFNVQGTYSQIVNLLNSFNSSNRLISIESVNISKPEDGPLNASITAKTYYYK